MAHLDLPTGVVTLMFTDIDSSTRLLHELGPQEYAAVLAQHRSIVREAVARHGGVEVDTQGDAFLVAFSSPTAAIDAAIEAQRSLEPTPVRIRIGVHTGSPHVTGEGYVGDVVHLGARVAAAAHGGQVLLTKATVDAAGHAELTDLGEHRVKDFESPVWIYQVGAGRFPPLKTISNTNLPRPASSFVGREREVREIVALLRNGARLLTLTGPGGTGKTRLSVEAASALVPDFKAGVFWIPLASLRDHTLVGETIARTLGAKDALAHHIGEREMLLVVDNLEQVIEAAPEMATLVESCPNLRMLATSRELLRVRGEVEYAVPPLTDHEAIQLFSARSGHAADEAVAALCLRLDNLPLAVELAAARASVLTPHQILERLAARLDLLKGGRDAVPRHQTLRATIEWSHDLLTGDERTLFARLAVFAGGSTLEAAEKVADADLDTLQSLVERSLVRHSDGRFWMLQTIRDYALERLAESNETNGLRHRHADYFLSAAEEVEDHLLAAARDPWHDRTELDHENFRAALDFYETSGDTQSALRIAGAIAEFWDERGHHREALRRYDRLLAADTRPTAARAKALDGASMIASKTAEMGQALEWAEAALALYRDLGDDHGVAISLWGIGFIRQELGETEHAKELLADAVQRLEGLGDDVSAMWAMRGLADTYLSTGDIEGAISVLERASAMARAVGDAALEAATLGALGGIAAQQGRDIDSLGFAQQSLTAVTGTGDRLIHRSVVCQAAEVLARTGDVALAATILGYADAQADDVGTREPWVERMNDETIEIIRSSLDDFGVLGCPPQ